MERNTNKEIDRPTVAMSHRQAVPEGVQVTELVAHSIGDEARVASIGEVQRKIDEMRHEMRLKSGDTLSRVGGYIVIDRAAIVDDPRRDVVAVRSGSFDIYSMTLNHDGTASVLEGGHTEVSKRDAKTRTMVFQPESHVTYAVQGISDRVYLEDSMAAEVPDEVAQITVLTEGIRTFEATQKRMVRAKGAGALRFFGRSK